MRKARFRRSVSTKSRRLPVFFYPVFGAALALPAAAAWLGLFRLARPLLGHWTVLAPALAGAAVYGLLQLFFRKPMTLYVFGHELTHAAAALLSGYKVKSLYVSEKGGEVVVSGTNVLVALAPYCVPIYTAIVLAAYALVQRYAHLPSPPLWVGFGLGLTLAFHGALTVHALGQSQPDLRQAGVFFSMALILLANAVVLAVALKVLFPSAVSLADFAAGAAADIKLFVEKAWNGLRGLGRSAPEVFEWMRARF